MLTKRRTIKEKVVELRDSYPNESNVILETAIREGIQLEQAELAKQEQNVAREGLMKIDPSMKHFITKNEQKGEC